jgi:hypothetical protein
MAILKSSIADAYTRTYDEVANRSYETTPKEFEKVVNIMEDDSSMVQVSEVSGLGEWEATTEGNAGNEGRLVQGYDKTFTHIKYDKTATLSVEAIEDDEAAVVEGLVSAKAMAKGAIAKCNKLVAARLYNGFATNTTPDGVYLFSASHLQNAETTATLSNLLSGALSIDNLILAETQIANNLVGEDGMPIIESGVRQLILPPALRDVAYRILASRAVPGTPDNDANKFGSEKKKFSSLLSLDYDPVELRYLAAQFGGSDTAWYIRIPNMNMFRFYWRKKPNFRSWVEDNEDLVKHKGSMRASVGETNFRELFGSTGL